MGLGPSLPAIGEHGKGEGSEEMLVQWFEVLAQTRAKPIYAAGGRQGVDLSNSALTDAVLEALVKCAPPQRLEQVVELACDRNGDLTILPDTPLRRLSTLNLGYCASLVDGAVFRVARSCPALEFLGLEDCELITDASLIELAKKARGLRGLNLRGCRNVTDASLVAFGRCCPQLETLSVAYCARVSDNGVIGLVLFFFGVRLISSSSMERFPY